MDHFDPGETLYEPYPPANNEVSALALQGDGKVLLAGSPRHLTLDLAPDIAAESVIEVDGEQWTVADVRPADGSKTQLICIYNV